jgi:hypothetical protein
MSFTLIVGIIAGILGGYSSVPYVRAILNGKTKPHQFSWLVFFIMNGVTFLSQFLAGARKSDILYAIFFIGSGVILLLSLRYGVRDTSKWDRILLGLALVTITAWIVTRNNSVAIWLTVCVDVIAETMLVLKIKHEPRYEDPKAWIIASLALMFTCLALLGQPISILYVRPVYGLLSDMLIVASIYYFKRSTTKINKVTPPKV